MNTALYCIVSFIVWRRPPTHTLHSFGPFPRTFLIVLMIVTAVATPQSLRAQDTVRSLGTVEVSSQRAPSTLRTAVPTQVSDAEKIEEEGMLQLSDAVRRMAGVTLKDYGGVGGMKTVSVRGLGSQFSTLVVDGVAVDNSQNGQVDLGRYLVGNAAYVSLSSGQEQHRLLSARAYAAGNVISLESAEPKFFMAEKTNLKMGMELGSFGMMSPSALWEHKWSKKLKSSLWVNWLKSDGDYPFTLYYTEDRNGQTSRELRRHSAMGMLTADGALFYRIADGNTLTTKMHYMRGRHQLPGPVHLYNRKVSRQNTREEVAFAQTRWRVEKENWGLQVLGKVQGTFDMFEDSAAYTLTRYQRNDYQQMEGYLSGSAEWRPTEWLALSGAMDGDLSHLRSNLGMRNDVLRSNLIAVGEARLHHGGWEARANLLATAVTDHVADLDTTPQYRRLSPYAAVMYTPISGLTLRYFYKETFRTPNFSELYFFQTQPHYLRPEQARQHNVGITYANNLLSATIDAYYNHVHDKIMAIPTQNMFYWSMENIGLVHIFGLDATFECRISDVEFRGTYSLQHAVDRSSPGSKNYGHQIAYTPLHTGGATLRWENAWVNLGATAMVVGSRYYPMQNSDDPPMPAYCDLGFNADRAINLRWGVLRVQVQVLNLLDVQYEVVRAYPMMGRNYRLKLMYEF